MPEPDERRKELRVPLPITMWFNILESKDEYIRGQIFIPEKVEGFDSKPELDGRDEIERFLLYLDSKLNLIVSLMADNLSRKDYEYKGWVLDVSESGLGFISPMRLPVGTNVEMGIVLPNQPYKTIDVAGEVVRDYQNIDGDYKGQYTVGISFFDILSQDEDAIVRWVFQKQREEIRRRKESASGN
jgi:hypothetical protein